MGCGVYAGNTVTDEGAISKRGHVRELNVTWG